MPIGPGKYNDWCTRVREGTNADGVVLVVFGGDEGNGFSVQGNDPRLVAALPEILENMAREIRAMLDKGTI